MKATFLSPKQIGEVIDYLERLARIYETLGHPEDCREIDQLIRALKAQAEARK